MKKLLLVDVPDDYIITSVDIKLKSDRSKYSYYEYVNEWEELHLPTEEEIDQMVDELAKETTAPDKDTPDWMRADIRRGINAIIKLLNQ